MRLFHVSEEPDIQVFKPRKPYREDLANSPGLVWAINERCLPNFLTPRDCPRVTYHIGEGTCQKDIQKYFSPGSAKHVVAIEHAWVDRMKDITLYLYEFDTDNFYLQDAVAGYYVSEHIEKPINKIVVTDVFGELAKKNIEVRLLPNLIDLKDEIIGTSLNWSMCRMGNAQKSNKCNEK